MVRSPRRAAGQGASEEVDRIFREELVPWCALAVMAIAFAFVEWVRLLEPTPRPIIMTIIAVGVCAYAAHRIWRQVRSAQNYTLGAAGERSVADVLADLGAMGYTALHDIDTARGNIDHVLIGPAGVFAIETKAWTKDEKIGRNAIRFDGRTVRKNGGPPDDKPVRQAKAAAAWLGERLRAGGVEGVWVQPVLVFPEWWVEAVRGGEVWVCNPKMLFGRLRALRPSLGDDELRKVRATIERCAEPGATH